MKPTMKKWLTGLLSAALLAGNLPVYALNTAYAAEEDGFFTDETDSFEGGSQESEDDDKVRILLQAFLNLPGLPPGKQKKTFQEKRTLKPLIPRMGFEGGDRSYHHARNRCAG